MACCGMVTAYYDSTSSVLGFLGVHEMSKNEFYRLANLHGVTLAQSLALAASRITLAQVQLWAASYRCPAHWTGGESTHRAEVTA